MFKRTLFSLGLLFQEAVTIHQRTGHRVLTLAILVSRRGPQFRRLRFQSRFSPSSIWKASFPLLAILMTRTVLGDPAPDLKGAQVTLPYAELKDLWQAAQTGRPAQPAVQSKPPMAATMVTARYQLALSGDQANGTAEFQTQAFTADWTVLPLLSTQVQIESIDPPATVLITRDHYYALVTNKPGPQTVKIQFAVKIASSPEGDRLQMPLAPASINTLTVTGVPPHQALQIPDASQDATQKDTYRLPPVDHVELSTVPEEAVATPVPSRWKIEPQIFVRLVDGKLAFEERLAANANDGSGLSMDLQIPPEANITNITGEDLAQWQTAGGDNQKRVVHLEWKTRDLLRRQLSIVYDLPQPLTAAEWKLQSPQIIGGEASPPLYVLELPPGLELTPTTEIPAPRQLPEWLAQRATSINFLVLAGEPELRAKWLPLVPTTRAIVESTHAMMQMVHDGAALTNLEYSIRHESALAWQIELPAGSDLLNCSVNGQPANPINRGEHLIEFSLPASTEASLVKLSYTAKGEPFRPVAGKLEIELPETELLTSRLDWELHIPPEYEVAALEGNVEAAANDGQSDGTSRVIRLHREIFKKEHPSAEIYYQRPETNN